MSSTQDQLGPVGSVGILTPFAAREDAWNAAPAILEQASVELRLAAIDDFVMPPLTGPPSRESQSLHVDFGLPLIPVVPAVVRGYVTVDAAPSDAVTRLVLIRASWLTAGGRTAMSCSGGSPATGTATARGTMPPAT